MIKVYVNLHPTYTYSNIVINDGYIEELKEYVKQVSWLMWDYSSIKKKTMIRVLGGYSNDDKAVEKHLKRTEIFLQRLLEINKLIEIFIRNSRDDEWVKYSQLNKYSESEMIKEESIPDNDYITRMEWYKKDFEKLSLLSANCPDDDMVKNLLEESIQNMKDLELSELKRKNQIRKIFVENGKKSL